MLETVRSRRIYGFLVLTILPASAAVGYYLRERKETAATLEAATAASPSPSALEDRLKILRRHEAQLEKEASDIREKLARVGREGGGNGTMRGAA